MKKLTFLLPVLQVMFLFCSCTASYDVTSTRNPEYNGRINKMLVVVIKLDSISGSGMEEEIANSLNSGMKRADSYRKIIPNEEKKTVAEILALMQDMNYDGLLIVSPYEGDYYVNPEIPKFRLKGTEVKGDLIKSYIQYKSRSGIYLSAGEFFTEVALFNINDEMIVWISSLKTEAKMFEFIGSRVSILGQTIFAELQKKKIIK